MFLSELKIKGYKVFKNNFKIKLKDGLTVLVGENGGGKTAIIDSIRLLLNEDEFGRVGISESHFHKSFDNSDQASSIEIKGTFDNLTREEKIAFLPWLDANNYNKAYLNKRIENKANNRWKYDHKTWGGDSLDSIFEWELLNSIACIYLPPLRDAENKLDTYRGSRLVRLFRNEKPKKNQPKHTLEKDFKEFNEKLIENPSIQAVNIAIKKNLVESLGIVLGQDSMLQFAEVGFDRIVEKLRILFFPNIDKETKIDQYREISQNSLGYNNILYLATVLAELDSLDTDNTKHKILLIEEPEAHLHPQLQTKLLQYLNQQTKLSDIQIIVTSHSPTITSSCGLNSINVLKLNENSIPTSTLINDCNLKKESLFFLERWLDITKSTLFFSKGILFVEGISESLIIKELSKIVIRKLNSGIINPPSSLEDYGVTIINLNGIYFRHFMQLFQGYRLNKNNEVLENAYIPIRCSGITDCDPKPVEESKPTPENKLECGNEHSFKYAQELLSNESKFCRIFTNLKTLEYDLALEGNNLQLIYQVLYEDYQKEVDGAKEAFRKSELDWESLDISARSEEAFTVLNKIYKKKAEFSQKLAYKLSETDNPTFIVPEYIESAIKWSIGKN